MYGNRQGPPKTAAKKGRKLDFAALAEDLLVHIAALEAAMKDVKREEREAEQALTKRDAAVAAFEPVYTGVADIAAGLLELAGQGDLASRVKPTVRRRAGLDLPAMDPAAPEAAEETAGSEVSTSPRGTCLLEQIRVGRLQTLGFADRIHASAFHVNARNRAC